MCRDLRYKCKVHCVEIDCRIMTASKRLAVPFTLLLMATALAEQWDGYPSEPSVVTTAPEPVRLRLSDPAGPAAGEASESGWAFVTPEPPIADPVNSESVLAESMMHDADSALATDEQFQVEVDPQTMLVNEYCVCCPRVWASVEYVLLWPDGLRLPGLVTTSASGTPQIDAARLNLPTTTVLLGQEDVNDSPRSGARFTLGGWIDQCDMLGVELSFLVLGNDETHFRAGDQLDILGRPFFHVLNDEQDAQLLSFPGISDGSIALEIKSEFYTGQALARKRLASTRNSYIDGLVGYRIAGLSDEIFIDESSTILAGPVAGTLLELSDQFRTRNTFHGVDLALRYGMVANPGLEFQLAGNVALGTSRAQTELMGSSTTTSGGVSTSSNTGFLVQPTNAGSYTDDAFSTVSEFGVSARHMFRPGLSLTVGYTALFWHDVIRAGDQIDTSINTSQFPPGVLVGEARPFIQNTKTTFWAHGIRVGLEYFF